MHNQVAADPPPAHAIDLNSIDQEILNISGDLPNLKLLLNPRVLADLRDPPSSLDTIETSCRNHTRPAERTSLPTMGSLRSPEESRQDLSYRGYLLKPRIEAYRRALEIYGAVDGSFAGKFSSRLQQCRKFAWFVQSKETNKLRVSSSRCKLRWCPICRDVSRMIVTTATEEWLKEQKYPKMITLTLMHSDDPLQLQIKRIYDCFLKLRRRAYFKNLITGGVWFFQLKFNPRTEQWHPHIHCLVAGKFLPHNKLKSLWHKITGDSYVVDIRPVKDLDSCAAEVARYATSPADLNAVDLDQALEIYYATKHRRICGSWGTAKNIVLRPKNVEDDDTWYKVADFFFINCKRQFDPAVQEFWRCFKKNLPYDGPQLQLMTEVMKEELYVIDNTFTETLTPRQFQRIITATRDKDWKDFYKSRTQEENPNGHTVTT